MTTFEAIMNAPKKLRCNPWSILSFTRCSEETSVDDNTSNGPSTIVDDQTSSASDEVTSVLGHAPMTPIDETPSVSSNEDTSLDVGAAMRRSTQKGTRRVKFSKIDVQVYHVVKNRYPDCNKPSVIGTENAKAFHDVPLEHFETMRDPSTNSELFDAMHNPATSFSLVSWIKRTSEALFFEKDEASLEEFFCHPRRRRGTIWEGDIATRQEWLLGRSMCDNDTSTISYMDVLALFILNILHFFWRQCFSMQHGRTNESSKRNGILRRNLRYNDPPAKTNQTDSTSGLIKRKPKPQRSTTIPESNQSCDPVVLPAVDQTTRRRESITRSEMNPQPHSIAVQSNQSHGLFELPAIDRKARGRGNITGNKTKAQPRSNDIQSNQSHSRAPASNQTERRSRIVTGTWEQPSPCVGSTVRDATETRTTRVKFNNIHVRVYFVVKGSGPYGAKRPVIGTEIADDFHDIPIEKFEDMRNPSTPHSLASRMNRRHGVTLFAQQGNLREYFCIPRRPRGSVWEGDIATRQEWMLHSRPTHDDPLRFQFLNLPHPGMQNKRREEPSQLRGVLRSNLRYSPNNENGAETSSATETNDERPNSRVILQSDLSNGPMTTPRKKTRPMYHTFDIRQLHAPKKKKTNRERFIQKRRYDSLEATDSNTTQELCQQSHPVNSQPKKPRQMFRMFEIRQMHEPRKETKREHLLEQKRHNLRI